MSIPFVASYRLFGSRALALAKYGVDYLPTRDRSLERCMGSVSTFKDLALQGNEVLPGGETRGRLVVFQCLAFGEIASLDLTEKHAGIAIELCCPKNASCAVVELWRDQICSLGSLLDADFIERDTGSTKTFFSAPTSGATGDREAGTFWVYFKSRGDSDLFVVDEKCDVGKTIDVVVTFRRVDMTNSSSGAVETISSSVKRLGDHQTCQLQRFSRDNFYFVVLSREKRKCTYPGQRAFYAQVSTMKGRIDHDVGSDSKRAVNALSSLIREVDERRSPPPIPGKRREGEAAGDLIVIAPWKLRWQLTAEAIWHRGCGGWAWAVLHSFGFQVDLTRLVHALLSPRLQICEGQLIGTHPNRAVSHRARKAPDFGRGPALGVYNTVAVSMLQGRPYDSNWAYVFRTLDLHTLFKLSLRSPEMCRLVLEYVNENRPACWQADEFIMGSCFDYLSKMPVELFAFILGDLSTADHINLARVSRKFRALCSRESQVSIDRLLRRFGLTHVAIRFMQSATLAIIAGAGVADFMTVGSRPAYLDFFAPNTTYAWVVRFFEVSTGYDAWPEEIIHDHPHVLHRTALYRQYTGLFLNINQSCTDSAMDCVPYLPFSHHMVSLSHLGAWISYPDSVAAGVSLPNRASLRLNNPRTRDALYLTIQETVAKYRIAFGLTRDHVCGVAFECPATSRNTGDAGCFELFFPSPPLGTQKAWSVYPVDSVMAWSLDGRRCAVGGVGRVGGANLRWRDDGSLMELPLLSRLEFDKAHGLRHFLVNTQHGADFAATRDRTTPNGGLWTFKCVRDQLEPDQDTRGMLRVFMVSVFGEIAVIHEAVRLRLSRVPILTSLRFTQNGGFVVGLRCPRNVSCRVQALYHKQLDLLRETVSAEETTAMGFTRACWFAPTVKGVKLARNDGYFYVQLPSAGYNQAVAVGTNAEMSVVLTRMQDEHQTNPSHIYYMRVAQFRALTRRNLPEKEVGLRSPLGMYGVDFAAVQASYDDANDTHVYKPLADPPDVLYKSIYSHTGKKRSIPPYEFSMVGCVTGIKVSLDEKIFVYYVTLGLPKDPTPVAEDLHRKQEADLAYIASVDETDAIRPFKAAFGPSSLGDEAAKPTAMVMIYRRDRLRRVKVGEDVAINCNLIRTDKVVEDVQHSSLEMLARMQSMGISTLANARYGADFDAVRKCSLDGGCLYLLKKMPEVMELGTGEYRGSLGNYTGYVVGEVDRVFTLAGSPETVLRMKLPTDATCAAVNLFTKQQGALRDVVERDNALWGGSVKESFFDLSATYPAIACVPDSFYAVFETSPQLTQALRRHATVVMKVSMSRHDKVNAATGETERRIFRAGGRDMFATSTGLWGVACVPSNYPPGNPPPAR
ncbi:hypothetical protein DFH06DRAFT_1121430 [Mycena polygramma]|nr:hypothetical protein DFH06DRAFT_1121430 [Mycena polygramma]